MSKSEMKSSSKRTREERRRRAARLLEKSFQHVEHSLDAALDVVDDSNAIATEILQNEDYSFQDWLGDALALSVQSCSVLTGCLKPESTEEPSTPVEARITDEDLDEDLDEDFELEDAPLRLFVPFDIKSETAGPSVIPLPLFPPLTLQSITDLTSGAHTISRERILVRLLGNRVMMSLCDLGRVEPGSYRGTLTVVDATGAVLDVQIVAECRDSLWWR